MSLTSSMGAGRLAIARGLLALFVVGLGGCDTITELIRSISDGASCSDGGQCLGGACLQASQGFPDGYCTTLACDEEETGGCTNLFGAECLVLPEVGQPACYEVCGPTVECRKGYSCLTIETYSICLPTAFGTSRPQAGTLGTACANDAECLSGACLTNYIGGYCSVYCDSDADCGGQGRCLPQRVLSDDVEGSGADVKICLRSCQDDAACRFGYECFAPDADGGVCHVIPDGERSPVRNPNGSADGEPCTVDINCKGGTCLRGGEGGNYPGGYCTTLNCTSIGCNEPAGGTATCALSAGETPACFVTCEGDADCRTGYKCTDGDSGSLCVPPREGQAPDPDTGGGGTIEKVCESTSSGSGVRAISFPVASGAIGFSVVPFSPSSQVRPLRLKAPDGTVVADYASNYKFQDINAYILYNVAPTFFPAAPQFQSILAGAGSGNFTLEVSTSDSGVCWYKLEKTTEGTRLDLNFYLVGVPGISGSNALENTNFKAMLDAMKRIYGNAGIQIGTVRFPTVPSANVERFQVIRSLDERLSINVFLIKGFNVSDAPGLLGISQGIPGVPGEHGNIGAGLVFTSEYLPSAAAMVGQTMAHEIGHYSGLRHTTEHGGSYGDPIADTPQCSNPDRGTSCPDARNFMFPFSLGITQEDISDGQKWVLRRSPFTK